MNKKIIEHIAIGILVVVGILTIFSFVKYHAIYLPFGWARDDVAASGAKVEKFNFTGFPFVYSYQIKNINEIIDSGVWPIKNSQSSCYSTGTYDSYEALQKACFSDLEFTNNIASMLNKITPIFAVLIIFLAILLLTIRRYKNDKK